MFALHDANKDGALSGWKSRGPLSDVRAPITYSKRTTITLGGKHVEMIYLPIEHADDNSIMLFPDDDSWPNYGEVPGERVYWMLNRKRSIPLIPMPPPFRNIALAIIGVIALIYLLGLLFGYAPGPHLRIS